MSTAQIAGLRARLVLSASVQGATAAALVTALNTWLGAAGEKTILDIQYQSGSASDHNALILYTE